MNDIEICRICGEPIEQDDEKIYCPDCGAPMHLDCFEMNGECPDHESHKKLDDLDKQNNPHVLPTRLFILGNGCEICGKPFGENDERVYCPDCGASMHRLCYNITHRCPFEDSHTPRPKNVFSGKKGPVCDRCGKDLDNGEEKVYCPICGTPVHKSCWELYPSCPNEDKHVIGYDWDKEHGKPSAEEQPEKKNSESFPNMMMQGMNFENFSDMILDHPLVSPKDGEEMTCRGVKQSELLHFLGINNLSTPRFFSLFMNMANSGKVVSINISAWLFMPLYHFYRRMTGPAIVLTLATFILMLPTLIAQVIFMSDPNAGYPDTVLLSAANITSYIMLFFRVLLLLFNDYIYMRWSVSKILSLRERYKDATSDEYYAALEQSGNPRMMYVLGGVGLLLVLVYMLNVFMSASGMLS